MKSTEFRRILVRGVNWLGDAVMTTPPLQRVRERYPEAHITLLTPAKLAELWRNHPDVNEVLSIAPGEGVLSVAARLRKADFDVALIFPNSPRSALETFLAGIPQRIGFARPWRNLFLSHRVRARPEAITMHKRSVGEVKRLVSSDFRFQISNFADSAHHVHEYLHLAAAIGANAEPVAPRLAVSDAEVESIRKKFGATGGRPLLGLNPGAEYGPAKRWPAERFIEAASRLHNKTGCQWWIFGGDGDRELAERIVREINSKAPAAARCLAGQTSLRELCAGFKACDVMLTNDTGPMHVAAAVGTPVVVPFGSTSPELTGPGLPGQSIHRLISARVPCSPCFRRECPIDFRCMLNISTDEIVSAVLELLKRN